MKRKLHFVVSAGPTREHLDPVRFLSNPSTGKMGFAVARAAARRGHGVTLVSGPVSLPTPKGVERIDVVSAREMLAAVLSALDGREAVFVSTAAVADWRPARRATRKLKKSEMSDTLKLVRNPDILKAIDRLSARSASGPYQGGLVGSPRRGDRLLIRIGFAAETGAPATEAARKCREKKLEFVVANDVLEKGAGFGCDTNKVAFVYPDGRVKDLPLMSKRSLAGKIVDEVLRA